MKAGWWDAPLTLHNLAMSNPNAVCILQFTFETCFLWIYGYKAIKETCVKHYNYSQADSDIRDILGPKKKQNGW